MTGLVSPIVLLCSERSGSNLITKMLDANPAVCGPGACHLYRLMAEFSCKFGADIEGLRSMALEAFQLKSSVWLIDSYSDDQLRVLLNCCDTPAEMVSALYSAELKASGKSSVVLKENSAYRYSSLISNSSVGPKYLFMVRDPRGMAASWKRAALIRGGVRRAVETWLVDQEGYVRLISLLPKNSQVAFLRYEDLLSCPEASLKDVCRDLEIPFSSQMLKFERFSQSAKEDAKRSPMWENLQKGLDPRLAFKYKNELTHNERAYIQLRCGALLEQFGYSEDGSGVSEFGDFDRQDLLEAHIDSIEPHNKTGYQSINVEIRHRFERWSSFYQSLVERPIVFDGV